MSLSKLYLCSFTDSRRAAKKAKVLQPLGKRKVSWPKALSKEEIESGGKRPMQSGPGKSSVKKSSAGEQNTSEKFSEQGEVLTNMLSRALQPTILAEIESNSELRNLQKFKQVIAGIELSKVVKPTKPLEDLMQKWLSGSPLNGRSWDVLKVTDSTNNGHRSWTAYLVDVNDPTNRQAKRKYTSTHNFDYSKLPDQATAERAAHELCRIRERIPFDWPPGRADHLIDLAIERAYPQHTISLPSIYVEHRAPGKTPNIVTQINYYDERTGERYNKFSIVVAPSNVSNIADIPPLPSNVTVPQFPVNKSLGGVDQAHARKCFDAVCYMSYTMRGHYGTKATFLLKYGAVKRQLFPEKKELSGAYGGYPLLTFAVSFRDRNVWIRPSKAVQRSFARKPNTEKETGSVDLLNIIIVNGLSRARAKVVANAIIQCFMRTGNIVEAWKIGSMVADSLNSDNALSIGEARSCACDEAQKKSEFHACDLCASPVICMLLEWHAAARGRVCKNCAHKLDGTSTYGGEELPKAANLLMSLHRVLREEGKIIDMTLEQRKEEVSRIVKNLKQAHGYTSEEGFRSKYTNELLVTTKSTRSDRHPNALSVEALMPIWLPGTVDGILRYHCEDNLAVVELCFNLLKQMWPPGILQLVKDWAISKQDDESKENFMKAMDDLHIVRTKLSWTKHARLGKEITAESWKVFEDELVSCKPLHTDINALAERVWKYNRRRTIPPRKGWEPAQYDRVKNIVQEIKDLFPGRLHELQENGGCPFPFDCKMPEDWSWWSAWSLFGERLFRMWIWCNGQWVTVDCIETLYLECLWQWLSRGSRDILQLPLSIWQHHPLRFAVAHIHHGRQMITAWTSSEPQTVAEHRDLRDESENQLNISFEACASNYWKSNFDEAMYSEMLDRLQKINLPKTLYDPQREATIEHVDDTFAEEELTYEEDEIEEGEALFEFTEEQEGDREDTVVSEQVEGDEEGEEHDDN